MEVNLNITMGARGFSCAFTGFGQVFVVTRTIFFSRSLPETSLPHSIAARAKKASGIHGTWGDVTRDDLQR